MTREVFNYPPTVEVLKLLTPGSLKQNLAKSLRLWVILRSIYGDYVDEVKLDLGENLTFLQWRNSFFINAKKQHIRDKVPNLHDKECRCFAKIADWLFASNLGVEKSTWCKSFQKYFSIQDDELENLLLTGRTSNNDQNGQDKSEDNTDNQKSHGFSKHLPDGRLFAVTSRNLKEHDFKSLVNFGWLKVEKIGKEDIYFKVDKFPNLFLSHLGNDKNHSEQFTHEELSAFNNSLSQPINGIQRFFIHTEYIVHPRLYDRVESVQQQLKSIWVQDKIPLVQLSYQSAKLFQDTVDCIVYPVCIYYYKRAPYLFAYGQTPQQDNENNWSKIDWYDYRLDRILKLDELPKQLDDFDIPERFVEKCYGKYSPTPDDIKNKMSAAWGFDIYKPQELLVLRFHQYFYGNYVSGTERDEMFKKSSRHQVEKLVKSYTASGSIEQKKLLSRVQSCSPNDIYCKVDYRVDDNNIVMRLRAWGPNVEVILPLDLRRRMKQEMEDTYKLYI